MDKEEYKLARLNDYKVIEAINTRWNAPGKKWVIKQSEFRDDMNGIDAEGYIETKTKGNIPLLIQIKSISFRKLSELEKRVYLEKISKEMDKINPEANQRLLCYTMGKNGNIGFIYNYSIKKLLKKED